MKSAIQNFTQLVKLYSEGGKCYPYWKILMNKQEKQELANYLCAKNEWKLILDKIYNYYNNYLAI